MHSPDKDYASKAEQVEACVALRGATVLFGDEMTFYRHPAIARAYAKQGYRQEFRADLGHRSNTKRRLCGALNAATGQVHSIDASKIGVKALCRWLASLREAYKEATRLILIWDNWPVHKHDSVLRAAEAAQIELIFLPTYAPWLNPIEKVWRKLKQEVLSLHRFADDWPAIQEAARQFLNRLALPSPELLKYVGLSKHAGLAD